MHSLDRYMQCARCSELLKSLGGFGGFSRQTVGKYRLDAGVDVLNDAEMLGHSSLVITMNVYQHVRRGRVI